MSHQVALIQITGFDSDLAIYTNGEQVMAVDSSAEDDVTTIREIADRLGSALGVPVSDLEYPVSVKGTEWSWQEVQIDLINSGALTAPSNNAFLIRGFYRCAACYGEWTVVDDAMAAMPCIHCNHEGVEPYTSGDSDTGHNNSMVKNALAEHERKHPSPLERGAYMVSVTRTETQHRDIVIRGAAGPASAEMMALWAAPDHRFQGGGDAEYGVYGHTLSDQLQIGGKAWWADPDEGQCSGEVTIVAPSGENVLVRNAQGGEFEVTFNELKTL